MNNFQFFFELHRIITFNFGIFNFQLNNHFQLSIFNFQLN